MLGLHWKSISFPSGSGHIAWRKRKTQDQTAKTSRVHCYCKGQQTERTGVSLSSWFETLRLWKVSWSKWNFPDFAGLMPGRGQGKRTPDVDVQGDMGPVLQWMPWDDSCSTSPCKLCSCVGSCGCKSGLYFMSFAGQEKSYEELGPCTKDCKCAK